MVSTTEYRRKRSAGKLTRVAHRIASFLSPKSLGPTAGNQYWCENLESRAYLSVTAVDDHLSTQAGNPVSVDQSTLLSNDIDANVVQGFTQAGHGTVTQNADGSLTYTPNPGFSGQDQFTYTAGDTRTTLEIAPPDSTPAAIQAAEALKAALTPVGATPVYNAGAMSITDYSFGIEVVPTTNKPVFTSLTLAGANNLASPGFFSAVANQINLGTVTLTTKDLLGRPALSFTFNNVRVSGYHSTQDQGSADQIDLGFTGIGISYHRFRTDGTEIQPLTASYNLLTGTPSGSAFAGGSDLQHATHPPAEILSFGLGDDIAVQSAKMGFNPSPVTTGSGAGSLNFQPYSFLSAPNVGTVPILAKLLKGEVSSGVNFLASNAETGATRITLDRAKITSYRISGGVTGDALETYEIAPAKVTETFTPVAGSPTSANWDVTPNSGTSTINFGGIPPSPPTVEGDYFEIKPAAGTGGLLRPVEYQFGVRNTSFLANTPSFDQAEITVPFGADSPGFLAAVGTGGAISQVRIFHINAQGKKTSEWLLKTVAIASVGIESGGEGRLQQDIKLDVREIFSSIQSSGGATITGGWSRVTGTGAGDFIDDFAAGNQIASADSPVGAAGAPSAVVDFGPIGTTNATMHVDSGHWTASHPVNDSISPQSLSFDEFEFTAPLTAQTSGILNAVATGKFLPRVLYTTYDGSNNVTAQYAMGICQISEILVAGSDEGTVNETIRLKFGSIAQVVNPTTSTTQATHGFGWSLNTNKVLSVTDPTYGVTVPIGLLDQTPEFVSTDPPPAGDPGTTMAVQVNATPIPSTDGAFSVINFSLGANVPPITGSGTSGGRFQFDDVVVDLNKSVGSLGFFEHLLSGGVINKITFTSRDAARKSYAVQTLHNVVVTQYLVNSESAEGVSGETIHLACKSIDVQYIPYDVFGVAKTPITVSLDQVDQTTVKSSVSTPDLTREAGIQQSLSFDSLTQSIDLDSVSWGVTSTTSQGIRVLKFDDVQFQARTNADSIAILATINSSHFSQVTYAARDASGKVILKLVFKNVFLDHFQTAGSDGGNSNEDTYVMSFGALIQSTATTKGGLNYSNSFGWSVTQNVPESGFTQFADFSGGIDNSAAAGTPVGQATSPTATVFVDVVPTAAQITLGGLTQTYDGTPKAPTFTTSPANLDVQFTYTQNGVPVTAPTNAGIYAVTATITTPGYSGSIQDTLTINKATAVVTPTNPVVFYDGTPKSAGATTTPAGLSTTIAYTGLSGAPTDAGAYGYSVTINDPNYQGSAAGTLTIKQTTLTVQGNSYNLVFGQPKPLLGGSFTGAVPTDGISVLYTTTYTAGSGVLGSPYAVVPTIQDPNHRLFNYSVSLTNGSINVAPAPASTSLKVFVGARLTTGQWTQLTATVASVTPSLGTPTGSLQFLGNGVSLGTITLTNGIAQINTPSLKPGINSVVVKYIPPAGANFAPVTSSSTKVVLAGVVLLDGTGAGALNVSGSAAVLATNTAVAVDSSSSSAVVVSGTGSVQTKLTSVTGKASVAVGGSVGNLQTSQAALPDPLNPLVAPATTGLIVRSAKTLSIGGAQVVTLQPGLYVGGISIGQTAKVTLSPGLYYFQNGGFAVSGSAVVNGTGVTLYVAPATTSQRIDIGGAANVTLSAPTTGVYQSVTLFQARSSSSAVSISGSASVKLGGALYAAGALVSLGNSARLDLTNNSLTAKDLTLTGSSSLVM